MTNLVFGGGSAEEAYTIDNSCRVYDGSMSRTPSSQGSLQKLTISFWVKGGVLGGAGAVWYTTIGGDGEGGAGIFAGGELYFFWYDYGEPEGWRYILYTRSIRKLRDPSAWYHVCINMDTTQSTETNRVKMYVNGERVNVHPAPYLNNTPYPPINYNTGFNKTNAHNFCSTSKGYIAECYYIDGTQYDADVFGETKSATNHWIPLDSDDVKDAVTFGTNGFYLDFADSAALGDDESGNSNDFTVTNLDANDQMLDTPTNNFCTFNSLNGKSGYVAVLEEVNLRLGDGSSTSGYNLFSTFGVSSGKWYYEYRDTSPVTRNSGVGWCDVDMTIDGNGQGALNVVGAYWYSTVLYQYGSTVAIGATLDTNVIAGVALDADAGKIWFSHNGTWWDSQDPAAGTNEKFEAGTNPTTWMPILHNGNEGSGTVNYGQDSSFAGAVTAQGNQDGNDKGDFYYTPPTGFLALCTDNLPAPAIADPTDHFNTVLYTGTGSTLNVTGVGFQPDFTWIKGRSNATDHNLYDVVRGTTEKLASNSTAIQVTDADALTAWTSTGFTLGADGDEEVNGSGRTFVGWNWKAGGTAASNTDGTITSSVSANPTAGFSIAAYTGTGSAATIGHGLSSAPELIIVKNRDQADAWQVYCASNTAAPETDYLVLNTDAATTDNVDRWNDTTPSASVFTIGDGVEVNTNTEDYIAYCFHSVEGYSKVGSFVGKGGADGPFIYTGFRPAFFLWKDIEYTGTYWGIIDNQREGYNVDNEQLYATISAGEYTNHVADILSNGIKVRTDLGNINAPDDVIIFMAFAESPFKTSNAR
jgi:hypothetical protein